MGDQALEDMHQAVSKSGRIELSRLMRIIAPGQVIPRAKSVASPSTQYPTPCEPGSKVLDPLAMITGSLQAAASHSQVLHSIADLQFYHGLRVSEVLEVHGTNVSPSGHIYVPGKKGSKSRIIIPIETRQWFAGQANSPRGLFQDYDRFWVYREYKKLGISWKLPGHKVASVTHLPRHLVIRLLEARKIDLNELQTFIGHVSSGSTKHYTERPNKKGHTGKGNTAARE